MLKSHLWPAAGIVAVAASLASIAQAQPVPATSVVVGPSSCMPNKTHYSTIQSAVSAVPAGSTVFVCPGTYPEQVTIDSPVTLSGVTSGTGEAAVITVPAAGLVPNSTSAEEGPTAVQLLIENTVEVTIGGITVDGTGAGCVTGANRVFGVQFLNVGASQDGTAAGKIQNSVVRNLLDTCTLTDGIEAENSYVTISNNEVHDVDITAIGTYGGQANISNNSMQNSQNSIVVELSAAANIVGGNVGSNLVPSPPYTQTVGIWIDTSKATVSSNTIANLVNGYAFYLPDDTATIVTGNKANYAFVGIYLNNTTGSTSVKTNIVSSTTYGIADTTTGGGNVITGNTVNEATYGIYDSGTVGDTVTPNTLFNVVTTVDPGAIGSGTKTSI
jgi:parallel beta-helix repeat protein